MLFRNLRTYDFTGRGRPRTARLEEQLAAARFEPCRPHQPESTGWVAPDGSEDGPLVLEAGERQLLCLQVEQRAVPGAVLRRELAARARAFAAREGRAPRRRELVELREALVAELRPRAFTRTRRLPLLIDAPAGLVLTDAVTQASADHLLEALRAALGNLPLKLPEPARPLPQVMTRWLRDARLPRGLVAGGTCVLRDPQDRQRVIRARGSAELAQDLAGHIADGLEVVELELHWAERVAFRLREDYSLRGLRLLADEDAADGDGSDPAAEFAAATLVETAALTALLARLREVLH